MQEYKHPQLVELFHQAALPKSLELQIAKFKRIAEGINKSEATKETLNMLKKVDDYLTRQILIWMKQTGPEAVRFASFYARLRKLIAGESLQRSFQSQLLWKGNSKIFYHLRFLKATLFGECSYFKLDTWTSKGKERSITVSFTLKACPDSGTIEPIYYKSDSGEEYRTYDYLNQGAEVNHKDQEILIRLFSSFLDELEKNAVVFKEDQLFNTLSQLLIALTY